MKLIIEHRQLLKIPSASGIAQVDDDLYVIGDDSAWLYRLNEHYEVCDRKLLLETVSEGILPKEIKPDFEAMTLIVVNGENELLIFGSGSKSPERDIIVRVGFKDGFQTKLYNADKLYSQLRNSDYLDSQSINIEAAATLGNTLYLFNREYNLILEYQLNQVLDFLEHSTELPTFKVHRISLPKLNGIAAKFSGAAAIPGGHQLVFSASVEDSPNTYDDGEVSGSYVGIINTEDLKDGYEPKFILLTENLEPTLIKIESVEIIKVISFKELKLVLVSDSDGGDSELLIANLKW